MRSGLASRFVAATLWFVESRGRGAARLTPDQLLQFRTIAAGTRSSSISNKQKETCAVVKWALIFVVAALVLAVLGFGGLAGAFIDIAQILFWLALIIAVALFILGYTVYKKVT